MREPVEVSKEILEVAGMLDDEAFQWERFKRGKFSGKEMADDPCRGCLEHDRHPKSWPCSGCRRRAPDYFRKGPDVESRL